MTPLLNPRMALRFLRGRHSGLLLTVAALACGVGLVCAIDLVNRSVLRAFTEVVDSMAGRASLQVSTGGTGWFSEDIVERVRSAPGVELAVPVVRATAFTAGPDSEALTVHGIDITDDRAVHVYDPLGEHNFDIDEPLVFLNQRDSVILTETFAGRRHVKIGSSLLLDTPSGRRTVKIRALMRSRGIARVYGGNLLIMDLYAAEEMFTRPGFVNQIDVVVAGSADVSQVAAALRRLLPAGLTVEAPQQRKADLHRAMQSLQALLTGIGLVALVAAFLIAFNRLTAVFEARIWQIGVLRAIGLRSKTIWRELLKESLFLGAFGTAIGIPLGIGLGRMVLPVIAATTALNYKLIAPETRLGISPISLATAIALGMGAALLAASLPAWWSSRVDVVESLRTRGGNRRPQGTRMRVALALGAAILACVAALALQYLTHRAGWGLAATVAIAVATALAARPLLDATSIWIARLLRCIIGPVARFSAATAPEHRQRTALMLAMIGVGLGAVVWLHVIANSFERTALDVFRQSMRSDLVVGAAHISAGYLEAPVADSLRDELAKVAGVHSAIGVRVTDWSFRGGSIAIDAFDPDYFRDAANGRWPLIGAQLSDLWAMVARGDAVIVSSNLVLNFGLRVGDTLSLDTPAGPLALRIGGVTVDFASPGGTVEMSRDLYTRFWNDHQVTRVLVRLVPGADVTRVRDAITRRFGDRYTLRILLSGELLKYFAAQIRRAFAPVDVLAALVLLVLLLGVADNISATVAERTREFAVVRSVGIRRRQIYRIVVAEALVIGLLGVLLAGLAGFSLGFLWVETTFPYLLGWVLRPHIPVAQIATVIVSGLAICLLAALAPARRAARLEPAVALHWE